MDAGNNYGVAETLTLKNDPPSISEMKNVISTPLLPIKG